jgi:hypothetical protein
MRMEVISKTQAESRVEYILKYAIVFRNEIPRDTTISRNIKDAN